ncbi:hypothetical protein FPZ42_18730 [Mucilaginibacter achroorhodeus]|uniref:Outer membrane protein beta-barrel domain-containing protein n=1 Tax=Mucilaginibacter achroorhodeus TaxID=2599294 RepID=A0A563TWZ0_9SPHI|nr:hypothetical protein [Mucilaginibacter achroorhodeus]TWR23816.1 hypothetical protein FPZ42_18730 [Mucilaginibacter achroorhodeus]
MNQTLFKIITAFIVVLISQTVYAQSIKTDTSSKAKADSVYKSLFNQRGKTLYLELLGAGVYYSLNYDIRFAGKQNGVGARAGVVYFKSQGEGETFAIPLLINYLIGKRSHYLEIGAGGLFFYHKNRYDNGFDSKRFANDVIKNPNINPADYYIEPNPYGVYLTGSAGYRYQPLKGGVSFRLGTNIISNFSERAVFWPYLSIGYALRNKAKLNNKTK